MANTKIKIKYLSNLIEMSFEGFKQYLKKIGT